MVPEIDAAHCACPLFTPSGVLASLRAPLSRKTWTKTPGRLTHFVRSRPVNHLARGARSVDASLVTAQPALIIETCQADRLSQFVDEGSDSVVDESDLYPALPEVDILVVD